jgi:hypothetical protein
MKVRYYISTTDFQRWFDGRKITAQLILDCFRFTFPDHIDDFNVPKNITWEADASNITYDKDG